MTRWSKGFGGLQAGRNGSGLAGTDWNGRACGKAGSERQGQRVAARAALVLRLVVGRAAVRTGGPWPAEGGGQAVATVGGEAVPVVAEQLGQSLGDGGDGLDRGLPGEPGFQYGSWCAMDNQWPWV